MDRNKESLNGLFDIVVVPYVGTWIEILDSGEDPWEKACRSLRGNVDRNMGLLVYLPGKTQSFPTWERG